jgi:hypothetical protein
MKEVFDKWRQFVESAKQSPLQEQEKNQIRLPGEYDDEGKPLPQSAIEPVVFRAPLSRPGSTRRQAKVVPKTLTKYIEDQYNNKVQPLIDWYESLSDLSRVLVDLADPLGVTDHASLREAYEEYSDWENLPIGHPGKDPIIGADLFLNYFIATVLATPGLDLLPAGVFAKNVLPATSFRNFIIPRAVVIGKLVLFIGKAIVVLLAAYTAQRLWSYIEGQPVQLDRGLEYYKREAGIVDKETADLTFGVQPTASKGGEVGLELDDRTKKTWLDMKKDINLIMQFQKEFEEAQRIKAGWEKAKQAGSTRITGTTGKDELEAIDNWVQRIKAKEKEEKEQKKEKSRANPYDDTPAAIPGRLQMMEI